MLTPTPRPDRETTRRAALDALDRSVARPSLSWPYRLGILGVAIVLWTLVLAYVALVVGFGYGLYWHATENLSIFERPGGYRGKLFTYVVPLVVGAIVLVFLVKPLFARRPSFDDRLEVDPEREPFLHEFVAALCAAVGAPAPRRILIDTRANASAGFHKGGTGLAASGRELTIGMPLVTGLSLRQFAGVLAHEFGHFSQGTGMRLSFLVMQVEAWFARVVFGRDAWDEVIARWSRSGIGGIVITAGIARGAVWSTRKLLYGLMWLGRLVGAYTSRQMEYDADRFEIGLAGSRAFVESMREIVVLGHAEALARHAMGEGWKDDRLPDDAVALVAAQRRELPATTVDALHASLDAEPSGRFATHPRAIDRIRAAERVADPGLFDVDAPATLLFDDLAGACRAASEAHYRALLGDRFRGELLVDWRKVSDRADAAAKESDALQRFFHGAFDVMAGVPLPTELPPPPAEPVPLAERLHALGNAMAAATAARAKEREALVETHDSLTRARVAVAFAAARIRYDAEGLIGKEKKPEVAAAAARDALAERRSAFEAGLVPAAERLTLALGALQQPDLAARIDGAAELRATVARCLPAARATASTLAVLAEVRDRIATVRWLTHVRSENDKGDALAPAIREHARELRARLDEVAEALGDTPWPFDVGAGADEAGGVQPSIQAVTRIADRPRDPAALAEFADGIAGQLVDLHARSLAALAAAALSVETAFGLGATEDDAAPTLSESPA